MSKHFSTVTLFSILCLAVVMTACGGTARIEEKSNEAVIVTRPSNVVIETFNGNIEVVTGADDKVAVEVTKYTGAGQGDALKHIQFSVAQDAQTVTVKAQWPGSSGRNSTGTFSFALVTINWRGLFVLSCMGLGQEWK